MTLRSVGLFVVAALLEIGGAWLVWQTVREHRAWWVAGLGIIALGLYGFAAAFQPDAQFGRILAAYGEIFVAGSLAWGNGARRLPARPLRPPRRSSVAPRRHGDHVRAPVTAADRRVVGHDLDQVASGS